MEDILRPRTARLRRAVTNAPIFTKLIVIYVIVMLVPTLAITFTAAASVRNSVAREVAESNRHVVRQVASNIDTRVSVARTVAESIAFNHRVRSFLTLPFTMTPYSLNVYMNQVALFVNNALSFHPGSLLKATVYMQNETIPEHWRMFLHTSRLAGVPWYQDFVDSGRVQSHVYPNTADHVPLSPQNDVRTVLTWVRRIDTVDGRYLGLVTLDILERDAFAVLHEAADSDRRYTVVNGRGQTVYAPHGPALDTDVPESLTIVEPIPALGLSVRADILMTELAQRTRRAALTMVFPSLLGFLLSTALAYTVLRVMFGKVSTMIAAMHTVAEGNFTARVPVSGNDELGQMARDFNHLIERIDALVNRVVVEEREKQQAQLAALQYQINPHFIYNTIDLFRMRLELDGNYETANALTDFGKMVRYTMAGNSMYATLEAELDHVRHFVSLQRIRHGERILLSTACPDEALDRQIMKLVLQPIVENCVIHGMPTGGTRFGIRVDIAANGSMTTVRVSDDGVGIPGEQLRELRRTLNCQEVTFSAHDRTNVGIGLANIAGRLRLFYGAGASFEIASEYGNGTTVTVSFPEPAPR